jgi:hypothetical protein
MGAVVTGARVTGAETGVVVTRAKTGAVVTGAGTGAGVMGAVEVFPASTVPADLKKVRPCQTLLHLAGADDARFFKRELPAELTEPAPRLSLRLGPEVRFGNQSASLPT